MILDWLHKKIRIAISILYFKDVHKALSCFIVFIPKWYWNALHIDVPKKMKTASWQSCCNHVSTTVVTGYVGNFFLPWQNGNWYVVYAAKIHLFLPIFLCAVLICLCPFSSCLLPDFENQRTKKAEKQVIYKCNQMETHWIR